MFMPQGPQARKKKLLVVTLQIDTSQTFKHRYSNDGFKKLSPLRHSYCWYPPGKGTNIFQGTFESRIFLFRWDKDSFPGGVPHVKFQEFNTWCQSQFTSSLYHRSLLLRAHQEHEACFGGQPCDSCKAVLEKFHPL